MSERRYSLTVLSRFTRSEAEPTLERCAELFEYFVWHKHYDVHFYVDCPGASDG